MAKRDLATAIAQTFLTGPGLIVSQRIAEEMFKEAMKAGDPDRSEALGKIRGDLRKLAEREGGV